MAASILDFWTNDLVTLAARLHKSEPGLHPELFERPFLRLGQSIVQLPWIYGLQNNSTAAINNLRRIGARRAESKEETRRIEERLGKLFESRSFRVAMNWHPDSESYPGAGEIDLICSRDGAILVIEVKSTFLRHSEQDAWLHGKTTLRRAGQQLRRKVDAVQHALEHDPDIRSMLGIESGSLIPEVRGWIVDTSIEHDHQRFDGFLKISAEEIIIALRDDRRLLNDPAGILSDKTLKTQFENVALDPALKSFYPNEFSALRFFEVIETEQVWAEALSLI
jgi:Holliday junction resolvase-like predicted endonuclease